ncbi:MAG: YkgJ family cysteine cluster protein [Syntrophaceae bacterium]|nr:YkgJ family cysteine cluster protein [Syntrophaceae bacterium]
MTRKMNLPLRRTGLHRETPFAFSCRRCLSCCRKKKIQINPYEIARLSRNRGLSTGLFLETYTTDNATYLKFNEEGACVFLDDEGCSVHPDRPLVCRLYPLGRHVLPNLEETFSEIEPDTTCRGLYRTDGGLIADYLEEQQALPFMAAADRYLRLFWELYEVLQRNAVAESNRNAIVHVFLGESGDEAVRYDILKDVDEAVAQYCSKMKLSVPQDLEEKTLIHIRAIEAWANHR